MEFTEEEKQEIIDYWQTKYVHKCKKCGGLGYIGEKLCTCNRRANASARLEINGFGRRYLAKKIEDGNFKISMTKYFVNFQEYYERGKGLIIFGKHSTGKTLACTILARNILENIDPLGEDKFQIKFFMYDDLVRYLYDDKTFQKIERIIKKTNILVLDNIGEETGLRTQARSSVSLLENIIRNREIRGLPIWITTNYSTNDLTKLYSENIMAILSRNNIKICSN